MKKGLLPSILFVLAWSGAAWGQATPADPLPFVGEQPVTVADFADWEESHLNRVCLWGSAEYLLWWVKSQPLSTPVVTTTTNPGATDANGNNVAAGLGQDGTIVLAGPGGQNVTYGALSGGRATLGAWLDPAGTIGLESSGFVLEGGNFRRTFSSKVDGTPVIGSPIVDAANLFGGGENAITVSAADQFRGDQTVTSHTRLWGVEANGVINLLRSQGITLDGLIGFRQVDLSEDLALTARTTNINTNTVANGGGVFFNGAAYDGQVTATDTFKTRNRFYGGQLGARAEARFGRTFMNVTGKLALGSTHQELDIRGLSTLQSAGLTGQVVGGTYALPSNIGFFSRNALAVSPEVEVKLGYNVTERLRAFVGYDFTGWSSVARPGDQIDRRVDVRQVPTLPTFDPTIRAAQPSPQFRDAGFWSQGINLGLELRF